MNRIRYIDLFCGIGGFHLAAEAAARSLSSAAECVFASDIDPEARDAYSQNFQLRPFGDILNIEARSIPDHDLLLGGFPCQAFSIIGERRGFADDRGVLFWEIARILQEKRPRGFVLENVKQLVGHDHGRTLKTILDCLVELGYEVDYRVLNALNFGLPQKRERVFIVGWLKKLNYSWNFPLIPRKLLSQILEDSVSEFYNASEMIRNRRLEVVKSKAIQSQHPTIWHENKSGHISVYDYSCALRAGASYNYLLVNGERRLTEREMLRLQGFPDNFIISHPYAAFRRLAGNSLSVPVAAAVLRRLLELNLGVSHDSKRTETASSYKDQAPVPYQPIPSLF